MLKGFVLKAIGKHMFARPRAILALPTAINEMEKRSLISTMSVSYTHLDVYKRQTRSVRAS